jgi:hypothetical protein
MIAAHLATLRKAPSAPGRLLLEGAAPGADGRSRLPSPAACGVVNEMGSKGIVQGGLAALPVPRQPLMGRSDTPPAEAAACVTGQPCWQTRSTRRSRPCTVIRAFLERSSGAPGSDCLASQPQPYSQVPGEQPR